MIVLLHATCAASEPPEAPPVPAEPPASAQPVDDRVLAYNEGRSSIPTSDPQAVFVGRIDGECGPLPADIPEGFDAQWSDTRIPRGGAPATTVRGIARTQCRVVRQLAFLDDPLLTVDCRVPASDELATRYAALRAAWGEGLPTEPATMGWHAGSRGVAIHWQGGSCTAFEGRDHRIIDQDRFSAVRDAIIAP